jgi:vacuolar-type H+-ATPase subunit I/STV1
MGLDMYLTNTRNGKQWYWRKANAIHGYFVLNSMLRGEEGDEEESGIYIVTRDHLLELKDFCEKVLQSLEKNINNTKIALDLLPPRKGFFFGQYEINEWYIADLKLTLDHIQEALIDYEDGDQWHYYASW